MEEFTQIDLLAVLKQKNPRLAKILPRFVVNWLRRFLRVDDLNAMLRRVGAKADQEEYTDETARRFNQDVLDDFEITVKVIGEDIPKSGKFVFVANHPSGGIEGMAFSKAILDVHPSIRFPVNDILVSCFPNFQPMLLSVNKHGVQPMEAGRELLKMYQSDAQVLYFPAGLVSRKIKGEIQDLKWHDNVLRQAIKSKRNIIPVYIDACNSDRFYRWGKLKKPNIAMLLLPDEAFRQKGKTITLVVGPQYPWQAYKGEDTEKSIAELKQKCYELKKRLKEN